ncbi:hypothetical protein [Arthrobacter pityocampae]|uniref:hypothetical protein n=1 Tax=Arthrobacter pityocampae TaxID=547334 RepID=UPI003736BF87
MLPVLDLDVVSALAVDLDSPGEALEFLERFQANLLWRVHAIADAFALEDSGQITAALMSLHAHALIVGALQLHAITGHALENIDYRPRPVDATTKVTDRKLLQELGTEAALFTYAYTALRSNPTLLNPPAAPPADPPTR